MIYFPMKLYLINAVR